MPLLSSKEIEQKNKRNGSFLPQAIVQGLTPAAKVSPPPSTTTGLLTHLLVPGQNWERATRKCKTERWALNLHPRPRAESEFHHLKWFDPMNLDSLKDRDSPLYKL